MDGLGNSEERGIFQNKGRQLYFFVIYIYTSFICRHISDISPIQRLKDPIQKSKHAPGNTPGAPRRAPGSHQGAPRNPKEPAGAQRDCPNIEINIDRNKDGILSIFRTIVWQPESTPRGPRSLPGAHENTHGPPGRTREDEVVITSAHFIIKSAQLPPKDQPWTTMGPS